MKARRARRNRILGALSACFGLVRMSLFGPRKPPRCRIQLVVTVNGRELVCTTSESLYYMAKWGGSADPDGWMDLLNGDGSLMVAASIQSSGSFGVYVRAVEQ